MADCKLELDTAKGLRLSELNPHLLCALCGGYLIDATTIIECLHAFCKTCILRYLETSNYCPICEVLIHKTRPWQNIRLDHSLQNAVYKLVPGLFQNEMKRRREFYEKMNQTDKKVWINSIPHGEYGDRIIFSQDEQFSISIEFSPNGQPVKESSVSLQKRQKCSYQPEKRYLKCPAALRVEHLKKFIRAKFSLPPNIQIDLFLDKEPFCDTFTLMDVAYIHMWKRDCVLRLFYSFYEIPTKVRKLETVTVTEKVNKKNKGKKEEKNQKKKSDRKSKCKKERSKERKQCQVTDKPESSMKDTEQTECKTSNQKLKRKNADPHLGEPDLKPVKQTKSNLNGLSIHSKGPPFKQKTTPEKSCCSIIPPVNIKEKIKVSKDQGKQKTELKMLIKSSQVKPAKEVRKQQQAIKQVVKQQVIKQQAIKQVVKQQVIKQQVIKDNLLTEKCNLFERMGSLAKFSVTEQTNKSEVSLLPTSTGTKLTVQNGKKTKGKEKTSEVCHKVTSVSTITHVQQEIKTQDLKIANGTDLSVETRDMANDKTNNQNEPNISSNKHTLCTSFTEVSDDKRKHNSEKGHTKVDTVPNMSQISVKGITKVAISPVMSQMSVKRQTKVAISPSVSQMSEKRHTKVASVPSMSQISDKKHVKVTISPAISQMSEKGHKKVTDSPVSQMTEKGHTDVISPTMSQMSEKGHTKVAISPVSQMTEKGHTDVVISPVMSQMSEKGNTKVTICPAVSQMSEKGHTNVTSRPTMSQISEKGHTKVAISPVSQMSEKEHTNIVVSPVSQMTEKGHTDVVISPAMSQMSEKGHTKVTSSPAVSQMSEKGHTKVTSSPAVSQMSEKGQTKVTSSPAVSQMSEKGHTNVAISPGMSQMSEKGHTKVTSSPAMSQISERECTEDASIPTLSESPAVELVSNKVPNDPSINEEQVNGDAGGVSPEYLKTKQIIDRPRSLQSSDKINKLNSDLKEEAVDEDKRNSKNIFMKLGILEEMKHDKKEKKPDVLKTLECNKNCDITTDNKKSAIITDIRKHDATTVSENCLIKKLSPQKTKFIDKEILKHEIVSHETLKVETNEKCELSKSANTKCVESEQCTVLNSSCVEPQCTQIKTVDTDVKNNNTNMLVKENVCSDPDIPLTVSDGNMPVTPISQEFEEPADKAIIESDESQKTEVDRPDSGAASQPVPQSTATPQHSPESPVTPPVSAVSSNSDILSYSIASIVSVSSTAQCPSMASVSIPKLVTSFIAMTSSSPLVSSTVTISSTMSISSTKLPPPSVQRVPSETFGLILPVQRASESSSTTTTKTTFSVLTKVSDKVQHTDIMAATRSSSVPPVPVPALFSNGSSHASGKSASVTPTASSSIQSTAPSIDNTFLIAPREVISEPIKRSSPSSPLDSPVSKLKIPKEAITVDNFLFDTKPSEKDSPTEDRSPKGLSLSPSQQKELPKNITKSKPITPSHEPSDIMKRSSDTQLTAMHQLPKRISQTSKSYCAVRSAASSPSTASRSNTSIIQTTKISTLIPKSNSVTSKSSMYNKSFSYPTNINSVPSSRSFLHSALPQHLSRPDMSTLINGAGGATCYDRAVMSKASAMMTHSALKSTTAHSSSSSSLPHPRTSSSRHGAKEGKPEKSSKVKTIPPLTIPKASLGGTTLKLQRSPGSTDHYIFAPVNHLGLSGHHVSEKTKGSKEKHNSSRSQASSASNSGKEGVYLGERQRVPSIKISDINRNPIIVDSGLNNHISSQYRPYGHSTSRSALHNGSGRGHISECSSPNGGAERSPRDTRRPSDSELLMNPHWHGYTTAELLFNGFKLPTHPKFHDLHYDTDAMPLDYSQSSSKS